MSEPLRFPDVVDDLRDHDETDECPRGECLYCRSRHEIVQLRAKVVKLIIDHHTKQSEIAGVLAALQEIGKHKRFMEMDEEGLANASALTGYEYFIALARKAVTSFCEGFQGSTGGPGLG